MGIVVSNLYEEVKLWSERRDITDDQIRSFIGMVEDDFKGEFLLPSNERVKTLTTDVNGEILIPADFLAVKHMRSTYQGKPYTIYRKPNDVVVAGKSWEGVDNILFFERRDDKWLFAPDLGDGQDVEVTYYHIIPSLVANTTSPDATNSVLEIMPSVYLFGCLKMLHEFVFNEERAQYYERKYEQAKKDLIEMQTKMEFSGSALSVFPTLYE
jgi:hypothetical protein